MTFTIVTLFPEILRGYFDSSIMGKAVSRGAVAVDLVNPRDFATDRHKTADDAPYGGGYGMVLKPEPLGAALESVNAGSRRVVYVTPSGRPYRQAEASDLASQGDLIIICGRYEGIDQRIVDLYVDDEFSVGDFILSSGEVAALVLVDSIYWLIDGVITPGSLEAESFVGGLLEYPHYTRPEEYQGLRVPEVLLSGNHAAIAHWRRQQSLAKTARFRPDLIDKSELSDDELALIDSLGGGNDGSNQVS